VVKKDELRKIVADVLEIEAGQLLPDTDLVGIDTFDSVGVLTLMVALDEQAGIKLSPADTKQLRKYGDIEQLAVRQGIALTD
jgi:acyl carrier protein